MEDADGNRPWWMTGLALFCLASVLFLAARDLFLPRVGDVEVWFGFEVTGAAARWSAPIHWCLFAMGAWAFWTARPWILPVAAAYESYIALCHLVWNLSSPNGGGWAAGLAQTVFFLLPAVWLWRQYRRRVVI